MMNIKMYPAVSLLPLFCATLLLLFSAGSVVANEIELPDIGSSEGIILSETYESRIGNAFLRQIRRSNRIIADPAVEHYIQSIGEKIVAHSDRPDLAATFFMIFDKRINAFAGPGGVIGINIGTLLQSHNESELAGVIAHEVAHVTQRHVARAFEQQSRYKIPLMMAVLGAVALGAMRPDASAFATKSLLGLGIQSRLNFTRANEKEADRIGIKFLARSGYNPHGMSDFFRRLLRHNHSNQIIVPEFLRTHPLTTNRVAEAEERAINYPVQVPENSRNYELMRVKIDVFSMSSPADAVKAYTYKHKLLEKEGKNTEFVRYGYAIALARNGKLEEAAKITQQLLYDNSRDLHFLLLSAQIAAAARDYDTSLALLEVAHSYHGNIRPLIFAWSKTLLDARKPQKARQLLRVYRQQNDVSMDPAFYELTAQAESQSDYPSEGSIAKAEALYLRGQTQKAIDQLLFAEKQLSLSYYQQQRVIARRAVMEEEFDEEKELGLHR